MGQSAHPVRIPGEDRSLGSSRCSDSGFSGGQARARLQTMQITVCTICYGSNAGAPSFGSFQLPALSMSSVFTSSLRPLCHWGWYCTLFLTVNAFKIIFYHLQTAHAVQIGALRVSTLPQSTHITTPSLTLRQEQYPHTHAIRVHVYACACVDPPSLHDDACASS